MGDQPESLSEWPGTTAEREGVGYDAQKIANIAEAMAEIMKPITGGATGALQGSKPDLLTHGSLAMVVEQLRRLDRWQAGDSLATTLTTAHEEFITVYQEVIDNFNTAIMLVNAGAGNYQATDIANQGA